MKAPLSEFLMEDWLESHRFSAKYNAGESGHRPQSLSGMLKGLQPDFDFELTDALTRVMLCDAPNMGLDELRHEVARLHPHATADNVLITTGTSEALLLLLRQLRPRKVAVITPAFQLLTEIPKSLGADIVPLPLEWSADGKPQAPIGVWTEVLALKKPDVLIFNHPHNPSGLVFTNEERSALLDVCDRIGCTVIGDEHYRFLASSAEEPEMGPTVWKTGSNRFVTGSFIKCAGTAGLRIGWCVGDPNTLSAMQSEKNYLTHTVNPLSQQLALWFLQSFSRQKSFFKPLYEEWSENRAALRGWLNGNTKWTGAVPQGGLVSCVFPKTHSENGTSHFAILRERGVFLLPLSTFSQTEFADVERTSGFRVGLGLPPKEFREMLTVMVRY
ncbi:MAG: pyridoxal phosphate-dependent aminotransferase [Proteobacteria bacterium]|nr:pyridoxal phosphate-dependent aminotransferase [Pseudomonadota bacterium]